VRYEYNLQMEFKQQKISVLCAGLDL
jgi:hypothetical protein